MWENPRRLERMEAFGTVLAREQPTRARPEGTAIAPPERGAALDRGRARRASAGEGP
jgi:hypothetical protein